MGEGGGGTSSRSRRDCVGVLRCCRFEVNVIVVGISATGIHCVLATCRYQVLGGTEVGDPLAVQTSP